MPKITGDFITVKEAADRSSYHPEYVRILAKKGLISAVKFSNVWLVDYTSLEAYIEKMRETGDGRAGPR